MEAWVRLKGLCRCICPPLLTRHWISPEGMFAHIHGPWLTLWPISLMIISWLSRVACYRSSSGFHIGPKSSFLRANACHKSEPDRGDLHCSMRRIGWPRFWLRRPESLRLVRWSHGAYLKFFFLCSESALQVHKSIVRRVDVHILDWSRTLTFTSGSRSNSSDGSLCRSLCQSSFDMRSQGRTPAEGSYHSHDLCVGTDKHPLNRVCRNLKNLAA